MEAGQAHQGGVEQARSQPAATPGQDQQDRDHQPTHGLPHLRAAGRELALEGLGHVGNGQGGDVWQVQVEGAYQALGLLGLPPQVVQGVGGGDRDEQGQPGEAGHQGGEPPPGARRPGPGQEPVRPDRRQVGAREADQVEEPGGRAQDAVARQAVEQGLRPPGGVEAEGGPQGQGADEGKEADVAAARPDGQGDQGQDEGQRAQVDQGFQVPQAPGRFPQGGVKEGRPDQAHQVVGREAEALVEGLAPGVARRERAEIEHGQGLDRAQPGGQGQGEGQRGEGPENLRSDSRPGPPSLRYAPSAFLLTVRAPSPYGRGLG